MPKKRLLWQKPRKKQRRGSQRPPRPQPPPPAPVAPVPAPAPTCRFGGPTAALYEQADWPEYAVKVHALKSTALTIGAEGLSAQAKELELAGKKADAGFIKEHHPALLQAHTEMCRQLAGV